MDPSTPIVSILVIYVSVVAVSRVWMEKTLHSIPNLTISRSHIGVGPRSAIAIDPQSRIIAYSKVFSRTAIIIKPEDIEIDGKLTYELKDTRPKGFFLPSIHSILNGNHQLTILTKLYDLPKISIAFPDEDEALRCLIALRNIMGESSHQDDKDIIRSKFIKALEKRISREGGSGKQINQRVRDEHILYLLRNVEVICGRPLRHRDNTLIADAMFQFFGCPDDDLSGAGYKYSTLIKAVSGCKRETLKK